MTRRELKRALTVRSPQPRRWKSLRGPIVQMWFCCALVVTIVACGGDSSISTPTSPSPPAQSPASPSPTLPSNATSVGNGLLVIGADVAAGRWFTGSNRNCWWQRLSGRTRSRDDTIASDVLLGDYGQVIVDVRPSDGSFWSHADCGRWFSAPRVGAQAGVSAGFWLVGTQVAPGTYRASVSAGCYWERLRDFRNELVQGVIDNDFIETAGTAVVTIASSDVGFATHPECGRWTRAQTALTGEDGAPASKEKIEANYNARVQWRR